MAYIKNPLSGGGGGGGIDIVNGIIEQYQSEIADINAQTFVEFVNKWNNATSTSTQELYTSSDTYVGNQMAAVTLDNERVFVVFSKDNYYYPYGRICAVTSNGVVSGPDIQISTRPAYYSFLKIEALTSSKVMITHKSGTAGTQGFGNPYGIICDIAGGTITVGTDTQISTSYTYGVSVKKLSESSVVLNAGYAQSLTSAIGSISGTTITVGTSYSMAAYTGKLYELDTAIVNQDKFCVAYEANTGGSVYAIVGTVTSGTVTSGSALLLSSSLNSQVPVNDVSIVSQNTDEIVIIYAKFVSSNWQPVGVVGTISGSTISVGSEQNVTVSSNSVAALSMALISNDKIFVANSNSNTDGKYFAYKISGNTLSNLYSLSGRWTYPSNVPMVVSCAMEHDRMFIATNTGSAGSASRMVATSVNASGDVLVRESVNRIDGLMATSATTSVAGNVWVLDTSSGSE